MNYQKGFSLVEVLVGSAIMALLGMLLYSIFASTQSQLKQTSGRIKIVDASDWLHNEYHRQVLASAYAVSGVEYAAIFTGALTNANTIIQPFSSDKVIFITKVDRNITWRGLSIRNGWLFEKSGNNPGDTLFGWSILKVAGDSIRVKNDTPFMLLPGRKKSKLQPQYIGVSSSLSDSLYFPDLIAACRFGHL